TSYPSDFHIHPKINKLLEQRAEMGVGKRPVDYGMAESLAFGSLLKQGTPVRFSGQDSQRGTFNQRHAVLVDTEDQHEYVPLANLGPKQARFEICNWAGVTICKSANPRTPPNIFIFCAGRHCDPGANL